MNAIQQAFMNASKGTNQEDTMKKCVKHANQEKKRMAEQKRAAQIAEEEKQRQEEMEAEKKLQEETEAMMKAEALKRETKNRSSKLYFISFREGYYAEHYIVFADSPDEAKMKAIDSNNHIDLNPMLVKVEEISFANDVSFLGFTDG